jgi:hypothetical protein
LARSGLGPCALPADHRSRQARNRRRGSALRLFGWVHAAVSRRARTVVATLEGERGQGTVEYVGLILLVSLLMVGMVAAMKGFNEPRL